MKRAALAVLIVLGLRGTELFAQGPVADTTTTSFEVNGLKVILRRNTSNEVVAANLYLLGGTQQLTPATQGIEALLLSASERGTARYPGAAARERIARLGSTIAIDPSQDWTVFGLRCIRATFDSTWAIFADRLAEPTLDASEVEFTRARLMTAVAQGDEDPDALLNRLADSLEYAGSPYALSPTGTVESLRGISLAQLRRYQATQMITSRMLLVVVGNVDRPTLERAVRRGLGSLSRGSYAWSPPSLATTSSRALVVRQQQLPTNYMMGYYPGPPAKSPDYLALQVATAVLSGRLFTEVRSKRNLSYAVEAPFVERAIATGGLYVTTVDPNTTLRVMQMEMARLKTELLDASALTRLVLEFETEYFLKNETNGDQASFLARAQLYQGDYRAADRFVEDLRRVQPDDVRRVAQQYMHDFRFAYIGNPDRLNRSILDEF